MKKYFKVDARAILTLGRDSIKDHTTAIVELVKNSYDADASRVDIDISSSSKKKSLSIRIADDGTGMSESEVEDNWLRVGYSEKREDRVTTNFKRRKTGEKGIGRLSADRLGEILELKTRKRRHVPFGLKVDWRLFDQGGKDVSSIPIDVLPGEDAVPTVPNTSQGNGTYGTELIISQLRQTWLTNDIHLLREELSLLTVPFPGVERDFEIHLKNDLDPQLDGAVTSPFLDVAELEFQGKFSKTGALTYDVFGKGSKNKKKKVVSGKVDWNALTAKSEKQAAGKEVSPSIGEFEVRLLFFPRKKELLEGTKLSMTDLSAFLNNQSGIKIYRDGIRVKPYGDPTHSEGDWLGLSARRISNPAGAGRKSFRIAANQIVGAVFLERDRNSSLIDSSSREGLIHGDAYNELVRATLGCVLLLESSYHNVFVERKDTLPSKAAQAKQDIDRLNTELKDLSDGLEKIKEEIEPGASRAVDESLDQIQLVIERIGSTTKSIEEFASQQTVFRGLATVGIAAAVFGHETQTSLSSTRQSISLAIENLTGRKIYVEEAVEELKSAKAHAERTSQWGRFALLRVKNDKRKRSRISVAGIIDGLLKDIGPAYKASGIQVDKKIEDIQALTFPMDIESVAINLLTNAYTACQQVSKNRKIRVSLRSETYERKKGFALEVADSGPGVSKEHLARIWEPLFTTRIDDGGKQAGTGLGLTIVESIVSDLNGTKNVARDSALGGAVFKIWLPA